MRIEMPLVALLVASIFFAVLVPNFLSIGESYYDIESNMTVHTVDGGTTDLSTAFNKIEDTKNATESIQEEFNDLDAGFFDSLFSFTKIAFTTSKLLVQSTKIYMSLITNISEILGLDASLFTVLSTILLIIVIIAAVMIIIGRSY